MMEPPMSSAVVRSGEAAWRALSVAGVSIKLLRADKETGESTFLLRFEAGARFPAPNHPGGEQVFVLEGDLQIGRDRLRAGDYLYTPPDGKHAASSERGCLLLATLPKPIEIIGD
jgi:anti-sigma factor ChrR (cupin superfamily)